jgi:hypothetical protein
MLSLFVVLGCHSRLMLDATAADWAVINLQDLVSRMHNIRGMLGSFVMAGPVAQETGDSLLCSVN